MATDLNFDIPEEDIVEAEMPPVLETQVEPEPEEQGEPETEASAQASLPKQEQQGPEEAEAQEEPHSKPTANERIQQEIARRKELEAKMAAMEGRFQEFVGRATQYAETQTRAQQEQEAPAIPEFEEDPAANLDYRLRQTEAAARQALEAQQSSQQMSLEQQKLAAFVSDFHEREVQFANEHPDYFDAVQHLRDSRMQEYKTLGWDDARARQAVDSEAVQIAIAQAQQGGNAMEVFYNFARQRGFQPKAATGSEATTTQLESIKEAAEATSSLGSAGSAPTSPTLEQLAEMDDEAFAAATTGDNWRKMWAA